MTDWRCPNIQASLLAVRRTAVSGEFWDRGLVATRRASLAAVAVGVAALLAACSSNSSYFSSFPTTPAPNAQPAATLGTGQVKAALILPLSAPGKAGIAGQAMRNAADMALLEFNTPNVQLLVKDDAGSPDGARQAAQQALAEGAEIIIGPLFAQSVALVGPEARAPNVRVIAFSPDANAASPGVYLLSFLPETDVARIVQYSYSVGKRSYAALIPNNPYGTVVEAAFRQEVGRRGGRIIALEHYPHEKAGMAGPIKNVADAAAHADPLFIPDGSDAVPDVAQQLVGDGVNVKRLQLLGTGLWSDDPRINAPDAAGYRNFANRYAARFKQQPVRTATLAYDAVALIAALVKTQGPQRFSPEILTNPSGFSGIDGLFRFRADGTNERGLAVLRVTPTGPQIVAAAPRSFNASGI